MSLMLCIAVLVAGMIFYLPIAFSLLVAAITYILLEHLPKEMIVQQIYGGINSYTLMALPLFVTVGTLMERGNISERLITFAASLVGHIRGGLAMVVVVNNMFMGGVSGSAVADCAATGTVMIPQMIRRGYSRGFAAALNSSASSIGIIIPPSIDMVIFGVFTGASVGTLFVAGFVPGILVGLVMMVVVYFMSGKYRFPIEGRFVITRVFSAFKQAVLALFLPIIILGGLMGGIFTPTEAGAVAVAYGLFLSLVYRSLSWKDLYRVLVDSAVMSSIVMILVGTSTVLGWVLAYVKVPQTIARATLSISTSPTVILLLITALLLVLGMFLHGAAMLVLVIPVMLPVILLLKINLIHFGILCVFGVGIGQQTPPVGSTLFVASAIAKTSIVEVTKHNIPFILCLLGVMLLILFVPDVALLLPKMAGLVK